MHSYLRAIGFSKFRNNSDVKVLLDTIINNATSTIEALSDGTVYKEYICEVGNNIGITVGGVKDEQGNFLLDYYYPFVIGTECSCNEEVYINKRVDSDTFTGMCDDYRIGVSLIFFLRNSIEYMGLRNKMEKTDITSVYLSAFSNSGKILLPTDKTEKKKLPNGKKNRSQLIADAKNGDTEALENLTIDEIDLYAKLSNRVKREDIFSIVDTSFIPFGSESDIYSITGNIIFEQRIVNNYTKEALYIITVNCNELVFDVCINEADLLGEPMKGRRFRGSVWMQGMVDFNTK